MMPDNTHATVPQVVYLAHGGEKYIKQAIYSIHTLLHWILQEEEHIQIVVYTDDTAWIPKHSAVVARHLSSESLRFYKGKHNYVHRVKLSVLEDAQKRSGGAIIFVDCDTKWLKSPTPAFNLLDKVDNICFMHQYEGEVSERNHPEYYRALINSADFQWKFPIEAPWPMWNSGTIGIPKNSWDFFTDAVAITDEILERLPHSNWVEQLAVSILAKDRFKIEVFEDYLQHFWRDSLALPKVLDTVLSSPTNDLKFNAAVIANFPLEKALSDYRHSFAGRAQRRLHKLQHSLRKKHQRLRRIWAQKSIKI